MPKGIFSNPELRAEKIRQAKLGVPRPQWVLNKIAATRKLHPQKPWNLGIPCRPETIAKIKLHHVGMVGQKHTSDTRKKMRIKARRNEANNRWKGDQVGLQALHIWVKARLPKPELCEECHEKPPEDLANKGEYNRDLINWEWLCRRCHMIKDGRLERLKIRMSQRGGFKWEKIP
jgi:hypothetical protein